MTAVGLLRWRMGPAVRQLAMEQVQTEACRRMAEAVALELEEGAYGDLVYLETDISGAVTALRTDMVRANRLLTGVLSRLQKGYAVRQRTAAAVPLGFGLEIPVTAAADGSPRGQVCSRSSETATGQTIHQLLLELTVTLTVLTPWGTDAAEVCLPVPVAQTVLVGQRPLDMQS